MFRTKRQTTSSTAAPPLQVRPSEVRSDLEAEAAAEDRRKHLELIQSVISRLATASASTKTWSVTLSAAAFAFSVLHPDRWQMAVVVTGLVLFLALLDARYLQQERIYRRLYDQVVDRSVPLFSMRTDALRREVRLLGTVRSWSVLGFYAPLFAVGFMLLGASRVGV